MQLWFWYFIVYSFIGFCLEKIYASATHATNQVRKCFLFLPLCPVYGLAMTAAAALIPSGWPFFAMAAMGGLICTGAEYLVHWLYDALLSVRFWDYTEEPMNLRGRVCLRFTAAWGLLSALGLKLLQPGLAVLAEAAPPEAAAWAWLLLTMDGTLSAAVLHRWHDTQLLSLPSLVRQVRASSQSSTSR